MLPLRPNPPLQPSIAARAPGWRAVLITFGLPVALSAGELIWSPSGGGTGGSGTWTRSDATWWDGTQQVPWTNGTAIFGGTGGTVVVGDVVPFVDRLVFTAPGYTLDRFGSGIWGNFGGDFVIETQTDATIGCALWALLSNNSLTKTGAGTLTLNGWPGFSLLGVYDLTIEAGTLRMVTYGALGGSAVSIAPGAKLALALDSSSTAPVGALTGEGRVEVEGTGADVVLDLRGVATWPPASRAFAGVLADGEHRGLGVRVSGGEHTFTSVNTYTGGTGVKAGRLTLTGGGALAGSPEITVERGGVLALGTTGSAAGQRLLDTATVTLHGGELATTGGMAGSVERFATLAFGSSAVVRLDGGGVEVGALSRLPGGGLQFLGTGEVWLPDQPLVAGVLAPHVTWGDGWATQDAAGRVTPWTHYASDLATAGAEDHVRLTSHSPVVLPAGGALTVGSLLVDAFSSTVDLGGRTLTLAQGGLLFHGTTQLSVRGGTLTSGLAATNPTAGNELVLHVRGYPTYGAATMEIAAEIAEQTPGLTVTKLGEGMLILTGNNTFTGPLRVVEGTLRVGSDAALGRGDKVWLDDATFEATASFVSTKGLVLAPSSRDTRIDTNGARYVSGPESPKITTRWDVAFLGETTGSLIKDGTGTLRLGRVTGDFAELVNRQGTLVVDDVQARRVAVEIGAGWLSNATSSSTRLEGDSFESVDLGVWAGRHELDLGGLATGDLRITSLAIAENATLTLRFDLAAAAQDHWRIGSFVTYSFNSDFARLVFDFRDGSGLVTGRDYTLWTLDSGSLMDKRLLFGLASELVAEGWAATFRAEGRELLVNFSAVPVPEPATWGMLAGGAGLAAAWWRRRKQHACDC